MEQLVELVEDNDRYVAARDVDLNIREKDTIKWTNRTTTEYTIHFEKSPFKLKDFTVPARSNSKAGEASSGDLRSDVVADTYRYDIKPPAASSAKAADPIVIVHDA